MPLGRIFAASIALLTCSSLCAEQALFTLKAGADHAVSEAEPILFGEGQGTGAGTRSVVQPLRKQSGGLFAELQTDFNSDNKIQLISHTITAPAAPSQVVALEQQIQILQSDLSNLQQQVASTSSPMVGFSPYITECGEASGCCGVPCATSFCCSDCCVKYPRVIAGVEVPFLRSRLSGATPVFNVGAFAQQVIDSDFVPGIRYKAELQTDESFAVRFRYFDYDHSFAFHAPYQPARLGIEIDQTDVEYVFRGCSGNWNYDVSGGLQYAHLTYSSAVATALGVGTADFEGLGPVFAVNANHRLGHTQLSLFGGVRASLLMGRINNAALLVNMPRSTIEEETMQVYSSQLGVQWAPQFFDHVNFIVKAAWETQYWVNHTLSDDTFGIGSNLNLTGPVISAELTF